MFQSGSLFHEHLDLKWLTFILAFTPGVNGLYVLTNTDMPAVLVELAFITNPSDEEILANAQDALARAVARGVTDYEQLILGGE